MVLTSKYANKSFLQFNPFKVVILQQQDILSFNDLQLHILKKTQTYKKEKVNFSKICTFKFVKVHPNLMFSKHLWNEEFKCINVGKRGVRTSENIT